MITTPPTDSARSAAPAGEAAAGQDPPVTVTELLRGDPRCADSPDEVAELDRLCGRSALAARVAAALVLGNPQQPLHRYIARIQALGQSTTQPPGIAEPTAAVVGAAHADLDSDHQRTLRFLSLPPGADFGAELVAVLAGVRVTDAAAHLEFLAYRALLIADGDGRYRLEAPVRAYAQDQLESHHSAHDRERAQARAQDWYLTGLASAGQLLCPDAPWSVSGFRALTPEARQFAIAQDADRWIARELGNIIAAQQDAYNRGSREKAWQVAEILGAVLEHRGHHQYLEASHGTGIRAAEKCPNRGAEIHLRLQLGLARLSQQRYNAARKALIKAEQRAVGKAYLGLRARAKAALAGLAVRTGDHHAAAGYVAWCRALSSRSSDPAVQVLCLYYQGEVLLATGDTTAASTVLTDAYDAAQRRGDLLMVHRVGVLRAEQMLRSGDRDRGVQFLNDAIDYFTAEALGLCHAQARDLLADAIEEAQPEQARTHRDVAARLYRVADHRGPRPTPTTDDAGRGEGA